MVSARSLCDWQAWVYFALFVASIVGITLSLQKHGPERLRRRVEAEPGLELARPGVHRPSSLGRVRLFLAVALWSLSARLATTGPPFLTDDPEPVDLGHWEAYLFATRDATSGGAQVAAPAVEFNLGAAPDLQLHVQAPYANASSPGGPTNHGLGDVELGVKYRFVRETDHWPQIGFFPMLELPTGNADRKLGGGEVWARLPLWVQKSWGPWTTYGGAGYALHRAEGTRSCFFGGWLVQRALSERLTLGGEVFATGADTVGGTGSTVFNAGGYYNFRPDFSLLFTLGHTFAGEEHAVAYVGLYWTWGPK